jgi:hypothetical protein
LATKLGVSAVAVVLSSTETVLELMFATADQLPSRSIIHRDGYRRGARYKACLVASLDRGGRGGGVEQRRSGVGISVRDSQIELAIAFRSSTETDLSSAPVSKSCLLAKPGVAAPSRSCDSTNTVLARGISDCDQTGHRRSDRQSQK